jgi:hypothetical protein
MFSWLSCSIKSNGEMNVILGVLKDMAVMEAKLEAAAGKQVASPRGGTVELGTFLLEDAPWVLADNLSK